MVQLSNGCTGDADAAIDLILDVRGNGKTRGAGDDAIRISNPRRAPRTSRSRARRTAARSRAAAIRTGFRHSAARASRSPTSRSATTTPATRPARAPAARSSTPTVAPPPRRTCESCAGSTSPAIALSRTATTPRLDRFRTRSSGRTGFENTVPSVPGLCQDGSGGPYATAPSDFDNPNVTQSGNTVQYWNKATQSWITS